MRKGMKILGLRCYFELPDGFDGNHEDAVRLYTEHFLGSPVVSVDERNDNAITADNLWARFCSRADGSKSDSAIGISEWDGERWVAQPYRASEPGAAELVRSDQ